LNPNEQGPSEQIEQLMKVLILKMKYDPQEPFNTGVDASEDEAMFIEMRSTLKIHLDSIAAVDYSLFTSRILDHVSLIFDRLNPNGFGNPNFSALDWSEAELALYLIYVFADAKTKGPIVFQIEGVMTPVGIMLSKMIESGVSKYPHLSIQPMYFEVICRYADFFAHKKDYLPEVLQSFLDNRGLFNQNKSIRLRVNYLFLRFVKQMRGYLGQYVESVLEVIQDLLRSKPREVKDLNELEKTCEVDSQIFLFEAVGYLLSVDFITKQRQGELLAIILQPSLVRIGEIIQYLDVNQVELVLIAELGDLISAIGGVIKGFPDFDPLVSTKVWTEPFKATLQAILVVLNKYNRFENIRVGARFSLQRMTGCLGPELLEFLPSFLSSGLLSSESAKELIDFLPFIGLTVYKFKVY
jgi:exportin-T